MRTAHPLVVSTKPLWLVHLHFFLDIADKTNDLGCHRSCEPVWTNDKNQWDHSLFPSSTTTLNIRLGVASHIIKLIHFTMGHPLEPWNGMASLGMQILFLHSLPWLSIVRPVRIHVLLQLFPVTSRVPGRGLAEVGEVGVTRSLEAVLDSGPASPFTWCIQAALALRNCPRLTFGIRHYCTSNLMCNKRLVFLGP